MRIKMPAVRIAQADAEGGGHQDILTCGVCQKSFALADIVKFIQHKVLACNKENYSCDAIEGAESADSDGDGSAGIGVVNSRRPSISAPMKKTADRPRHHSPASHTGDDEPRCSTPIKPDPDTPRIKQELLGLGDLSCSPDEAPCKKLRTEVADAESNTTHSEPSNYVCSTCKQRVHSAWRLVQHVQTCHGIRLYLETSASSTASSPGAKNHSTGSASSYTSSSSSCSGSGNASGGPTTPSLSLLPPARLGLPPSSPMVDPHHAPHHTLPLHNPFTVGGLLRMPHQFPPTSLAAPHHSPNNPLFARPSPSSHEHHFRMERLVSEQIRLNQQHALGLAAAAAAGVVPPPHSPFPPPSDRPPIGPPTSNSRPVIPPPPSLPLALDPQIDFYSQRLRQLAGTTSPGAANGSPSPSPRKLSPPFTSPSSKTPPVTGPLSSGPSPASSNNNNNSNTSNNNNVTPPRNKSETPPQKDSQDAETPANNSTELSTTPRSASSPPANKPSEPNSESAEEGEGRSRACEYCGKRFRFQSNLLVHRRTHTGEKPYKCSVCNHACTQSSKLKRHMKIHRRSNQGNGQPGGEGGAAATNGSSISAPDQISNAGSVESLDDDCDDEDDEEMDEEEDEEEEEEEDMELEDEEGDEDDEGGDAPEDLTTKSTSSTPPNANEKNSSSTPRPTPTVTPLEKVTTSGSLVGELMDKFGLSNIQQYNEAYKQALQESVGSHPLLRKEELLQRSLLISDNNNSGKQHPSSLRHLENGLMDKAVAMRFREEFTKNIITGQPSMDMVRGPPGLFGPGTPFDNPFDAKRMKLELDNPHHPLGRGPEHENLYAGLWLPAMAAAHHREQMFGVGDTSMDMLNRSKNTPDNMLLKNGPKPGPSASSLAAAAAAAAMNLVLPGQTMKKDSRRNDTCEYCGKVFKNCSNLTVHRRSHTGEKPYKCELCSYACAQSSKLTRHMKTHGRMGKDVYRCRFCEMPFSVPSTLEKHMRKCVVNQNNKAGHILPSIMKMDEEMKMHMKMDLESRMDMGLRMEDDMESRDDGDSSASASKDTT